jgi:hypothetical protein
VQIEVAIERERLLERFVSGSLGAKNVLPGICGARAGEGILQQSLAIEQQARARRLGPEVQRHVGYGRRCRG